MWKEIAALWKGIRSLVNIKPTNKSDISIIDNNGNITDPSYFQPTEH